MKQANNLSALALPTGASVTCQRVTGQRGRMIIRPYSSPASFILDQSGKFSFFARFGAKIFQI
ncbi:MAG: hypothetical protein R6U55_14780, partial [Desulfovermiculus sp.]